MPETILKMENLNVKLDGELIICNLSFEGIFALFPKVY